MQKSSQNTLSVIRSKKRYGAHRRERFCICLKANEEIEREDNIYHLEEPGTKIYQLGNFSGAYKSKLN